MLFQFRYQKKCDELEVSNGQFNDKFIQMDADKKGIVAFWKKQVEEKSMLLSYALNNFPSQRSCEISICCNL